MSFVAVIVFVIYFFLCMYIYHRIFTVIYFDLAHGCLSEIIGCFLVAYVLTALTVGGIGSIFGGSSSKKVSEPTKIETNVQQRDSKSIPDNTTKQVNNTSDANKSSNTGVITDEEGLNIRKGPGTSFDVVETLPYGNIVTVGEEKDGWYKVSYSGTNGWCSAKFVGRMESVNRSGIIVADETNIRSGPSTNGKILGVFENGEKIYAVGRYNLWLAVRRAATGDQIVWVYAKYVRLQ